ncbi:MAG TPA: sugar phosphate isomerase/epimerase [Gemmataceae bacterium]|nr:sugar phosphate isomerase/epimerase [Gemmataceae bacterium]
MDHRSSRRRFLQWTGAAAATVSLTGKGFGPALAAPADTPADKPRGGKAINLGLASYTTRKLTLEQTLALMRRVDLKYLCLKSVHLPLDAKPPEIAAVAAKVRQARVVLYGGGVITMHQETQVAQAFDYAKAAGLEMIVAAPTADMLPLIEAKVKQYNITVAIHNHGPGDKHFPTPASVYDRVKDLDPRLGLCIDIGHTVRSGADLITSTKKYADRLLDFHMKDIVAAAPKSKDVPVGRGVIDIPRFLRTLVEVKYAGRVSFEYEPDPDDPLPGLAESVGFTRGVLATM